MADVLFLLVAAVVMGAVTYFTRAAPFIFFRRRDPPRALRDIEMALPPMILTILVIYCLKDITLTQSPFGIPEVACVLLVGAVHVWKRNVMLSIVLGTVLYMLIVQSGVLV